MSEFLKEYLAEASQYTHELEHLLLELDKDPENGEVRREALRAAHNLKGISAYMGYEAIAKLAHELENILESGGFQERESLFFKLDQINALLRELREKGELSTLSEEAHRREEDQIARFKALLKALKEEDEDLYQAFMELLEEKIGLLSAICGEEVIEPSKVAAVREHLEKIKNSARYLNLDELVSFLEEFEEQLSAVEKGEDAHWRPYWETLVALVPKRETAPELENFLSELSEEIEALSSLSQEATEVFGDEEAGGSPEIKAEEEASPEPVLKPPSETQPVPERLPEESLPEIFLRIEADRVARISSMVDELRSLGYRLQEIANETKAYLPREWRLKLDEALLSFSTLSRSLAEEMQSLRLVPVDSLAVRVERLFRDLVKSTGKEAELIFEGHDLKVDRVILQEIWPALVHLMRNAFDHGLENKEDRLAAGKPEKGRVRVSFETEQNWLKITVEDDGRGIDWAVVERKARERGLSAERPEDFLFIPGFSTKEEADTLSGRGFGLDIVKQTVENLRGYVVLSSNPGEGTQVSLYLPLGTALNRVILVKSGRSLWAVPFYALKEVKRVTPTMLSRVSEDWVYNYRGESVTVIVPDPKVLERVSLYLILMSGKPAWGIAVSELVGQQEASLKPFSENLRKFGPFLGLALLADGGVAFVLDHRSFEPLKRFLGKAEL